mmetsp:Transcript_48342/g.151591  ORF Transcript_48342/g.151591 Transcript_48342/m.151591 type:complete len:310 (-) Transcript_48342:65-994(-)
MHCHLERVCDSSHVLEVVGWQVPHFQLRGGCCLLLHLLPRRHHHLLPPSSHHQPHGAALRSDACQATSGQVRAAAGSGSCVCSCCEEDWGIASGGGSVRGQGLSRCSPQDQPLHPSHRHLLPSLHRQAGRVRARVALPLLLRLLHGCRTQRGPPHSPPQPRRQLRLPPRRFLPPVRRCHLCCHHHPQPHCQHRPRAQYGPCGRLCLPPWRPRRLARSSAGNADRGDGSLPAGEEVGYPRRLLPLRLVPAVTAGEQREQRHAGAAQGGEEDSALQQEEGQDYIKGEVGKQGGRMGRKSSMFVQARLKIRS